MCSLTATDILRIWELGERQGPFDQALTVLAATYPERSMDQLADLSLGERDRLLFRLRQQLFGQELRGYVECPECRERLEFSFGVSEICGAGPAEVREGLGNGDRLSGKGQAPGVERPRQKRRVASCRQTCNSRSTEWPSPYLPARPSSTRVAPRGWTSRPSATSRTSPP